jgi:hypothetical protein
MPIGKYTIVYETGGIRYKLCKIWFGSDGSYYVTSPYHTAEKAYLFKATINYAHTDFEIAFSEMLELGSVEDGDHRLKLSHHPDGFIQFSGQGIVSGIDEQGQIRGMGIKSWPLAYPVRGPAFSVTVHGIEHFQVIEEVSKGDCVFTEQEVIPIPVAGSLVFGLEGYYFPALWRRFAQPEPNGTHSIRIVHPSGAVLPLKVLFPSERSRTQAFLGIEMHTDVSVPGTPSPSFMLSSSTGNIRHNEQGERLGDAIFCVYPREFASIGRSLDYMPAPPTTD